MSSPVPTKTRPETQTVKEMTDAFLEAVDEVLKDEVLKDEVPKGKKGKKEKKGKVR